MSRQNRGVVPVAATSHKGLTEVQRAAFVPGERAGRKGRIPLGKAHQKMDASEFAKRVHENGGSYPLLQAFVARVGKLLEGEVCPELTCETWDRLFAMFASADGNDGNFEKKGLHDPKKKSLSPSKKENSEE